jgi:hypothetical protein
MAEGFPLNSESAMVLDGKLWYLLEAEPERNSGKTACFSRLGFTTANAEDLRMELLNQLSTSVVTNSRTNEVGGTNYEVRMTLNGPSGSGIFKTIWSTTTGQPSFITAVPWREPKRRSTLQE